MSSTRFRRVSSLALLSQLAAFGAAACGSSSSNPIEIPDTGIFHFPDAGHLGLPDVGHLTTSSSSGSTTILIEGDTGTGASSSSGFGSSSESSASSGPDVDAGSGSSSSTASGSGSGSGSESSSGSESRSSSGSSSGSHASSGSSGSSSSSSSSSMRSGLPGSQIVVGNDLTVYGVTTDGYVVYYDHTHSSVNTVAIGGGTPNVVAANAGTNFQIYTAYEVVLVWTNTNASGVGGLVSWSALDGSHTLSSASYSGYAAVDATSRYIMYTTNVNAAVTPVALDVVGSLTDGTSVSALEQSVQPPPYLYFSIEGSHGVINYLPTTGGVLKVNTFALGQWTNTAITSADNLIVQAVDSAGTELLVTDAATNTLEVFPMTGGVGSGIATNLLASPSIGSVALLTGNGKSAIFAGSAGATLDLSPVTTPSTSVLANGTNLTLDLLSPDGARLVAYGGATPSVYVGSATTLGNLTVLCPSANFGGTSFTNDSSHVLFVPNFNIGSSGVGPLNSYSVATGTSTMIDPAINLFQPTGTSKAVFSDNLTATTNDIKVFDSATTAAPELIIASAQPSWIVGQKAGVDNLVYSWSVTPGANAGIYVTPVP